MSEALKADEKLVERTVTFEQIEKSVETVLKSDFDALVSRVEKLEAGEALEAKLLVSTLEAKVQKAFDHVGYDVKYIFAKL
jgi:hypothetical protein